jgi:hypothetical protein
MKRLYGMLEQLGFLKKFIHYHLERGDYCHFLENKGHHINKCIEFHYKVARMFDLERVKD